MAGQIYAGVDAAGCGQYSDQTGRGCSSFFCKRTSRNGKDYIAQGDRGKQYR